MAYHPSDNERDFHDRTLAYLTWEVNAAEAVEKLFRYADTDEEVPVIPDPSLFNFTTGKEHQDGSFRLPTVAECATHLELLAAFSTLRGKVLNSPPISRTMGFASETRPSQARVDAWQEEKWTKYVEFAVVRFLEWRAHIEQRRKAGSIHKDLFGVTDARHIPIDVMMVWSVFMLNPALYEKHCSKDFIYEVSLPWKVIHESINSEHEWLWAPESEGGGHMETSGLGMDLLRMFETWQFPLKQERSKQYPGLREFDFIKESVENKNCPDKEHKKLVDRYVRAFANVNWTLATELKEAVLRQESFWRKMTDNMWIRSPAVEGTLKRAIGRYDQFMEIMGEHPKTVVVPALDIDLVWHTHQCSGGRAYATQTRLRTGQFVNHDDKLKQTSLEEGYGATRLLYRRLFGTEYRVCGCWECELLISEMEKVVHLEPANVNMTAIVDKVKKNMLFYRAVESMRRHGRRLPAALKESLP